MAQLMDTAVAFYDSRFAHRIKKDPWIITGFYLQYIRLHEKTATIVRGDCGTENVVVARIQRHLGENHNDSFADLA